MGFDWALRAGDEKQYGEKQRSGWQPTREGVRNNSHFHGRSAGQQNVGAGEGGIKADGSEQAFWVIEAQIKEGKKGISVILVDKD